MPSPASADAVVDNAEWAKWFAEFKAEGTMVVHDQRNGVGRTLAFNPDRAKKRFSPASTFKIPHALFALDAGVIRDEFEAIPWDGTQRSIPAWNQDQTLRSSMRHSAVWVYESFAKEIGEKREKSYLEKIAYGNEDPTGNPPFWLEGNLRVSANEQLEFLKKLYRNELPLSVANQRLVKDIMITEAGPDWILRAKTGWSGAIGWWVGWVECPTGAVFFAINIDTPNRLDDLPKRQAIARDILTSLGALEPTDAISPKK